MKAKLRLGAIAAALGLLGCEKPPEDHFVVIRGQFYLIPGQDYPVISSVGDKIYVRLLEEYGEIRKFQLLYDTREYDLNVKIGSPNLFGVVGDNEDDIRGQLRTFKVENDMVFCHDRVFGKELHFTCGIRITDADVSWSVNFDESQIADAPLIKAEAEKLLKSYREAAEAAPPKIRGHTK